MRSTNERVQELQTNCKYVNQYLDEITGGDKTHTGELRSLLIDMFIRLAELEGQESTRKEQTAVKTLDIIGSNWN